jgi:hypothetical protein
MTKQLPREYYTCHYTGQTLHYTEFVLAGSGWLAVDGTKRHPISRSGKTINQSLVNGLRLSVNGKLTGISHPNHPNHLVYKQIVNDVRQENNYKGTWLRVDLSKQAYIRTYEALNIQMPDLGNLNLKGNRKSNNSDACLDYLDIPNDRSHREVKIGKYFVDGLKDNFVVEFFGDYFHANPEFYVSDQKLLGGTAESKWEKDAARLKCIQENGYHIVKVWENDWNKFKQKNTDKLKVEFNDKQFFINNLKELSDTL